MKIIGLYTISVLLFMSVPVSAQTGISSCRAQNDDGTKHCSISCPLGEQALCQGGGPSIPLCTCAAAHGERSEGR